MKRIKNLMKTVFVFVLILGMAMGQTEVSSLAYTVEFTHDGHQYVLPGDTEVAISEVLDTVGLTGEVSDVVVSNESLFSVKKCRTTADGNTPEKDEDGNVIEDENGTWFVFAHQAFSSEEWMKVTIGGVVYEITVTDDNATADLTITTIDEWKTFAKAVANGTDYSGKTVALGADLDFSGTSFTYEYIVGFLKNGDGYDNGSKSFKGTFDGDGHAIKNVTITAKTNDLRVGCLFYMNEGTIRNTVFDNITITAIPQCAGFIAHTNAGTIDGCTISGAMNRVGDGRWMGGVVNTNSGTIQNCYVNVKDPNGNVVYNNDNNGKGTLTNVYCTSDCTGTKQGQGTVVYKFVAVENGGISSLAPTTEPVCTFGTNKYYTADTGVTFNAEVESGKTADPIYCNGVPVSKNSDGSYTFTVAEEDVKVQTRESLPDHTITCADASGGTITASPSTAHAYEEITLTATPESGYLLNGITATTSDSKSVNVSYEPWYEQINTASFRMPDANVTVTPVFTAINNTSNDFSINIPKTGTETVTVPSGMVSFKVYDHAGASGNYGTNCNGTLTLTAPTGYGFQISGSVDVYGNSLGYQVPVSISDGTNTIYSATRVNTTLSPIICNSNTLTIEFISDNQAFHNDHAGLDLTVSLINLSQTHNVTIGSTDHGTMTSDVASAKAGTKVTLTAAPATDGNTHYMLEGVSVTYTENGTTKNIAVDGGWWTNNVLTFTMPYSDVVVTPTFVEGNADGGPNINGLTYVGKTDTEQGYYKIDSPTALNVLAAYVNGGGRNVDMLFKQTADINMSGQGYTPIGEDNTNTFNGTYDGDGYVILNISHTDNGSRGKSGMFGRIANGTVKNVNLKECNYYGKNAGGIAGEMYGGTVDNCTVIGGTVSCGANNYSGGIVGYLNAGTVKDCFAANTVSANSADTGQNGPIVGKPGGYTANNYFTKAVSGGNSTGTVIFGGFVTVGEGVTIGSGVWRTIGRTAEHTYYFGEQGDAITFSAEVPTTGMKKFTKTDGTLGSNAEGKCTLTMPASNVTVSLADVTPTISSIENQTYTGSAIEPSVTVKDGETTFALDTDYTVSYSNNTAVGTATVTITGKGKYLGTASTTFEIGKATHSDQTAGSSAKFGASGTVDLSALIVDGGTVGTITKTDVNNVLNGDPTVTDGKLNFAFANTAGNADKTATVTLPITSTNYENYNITITLTVNAKDVPTLTVDPITKTYDGAAVTGAQISGTATVNGMAVAGTWAFENGASFVNAADSGAKKVIFTPEDTDNYDKAEVMLALTINKAVITIKAADKSIYVGDTVPDLNSPVSGNDYTVTGLVGSDQLAGTLTLSYSATPDNTKAGSYTITPGGAAVPTGGNYADDIVYQTGTLTIKVKSGGGSGSGGSDSGSGGGSGSGSGGSGSSEGGDADPGKTPEPGSEPTIVEQQTETTQNLDGSTTTTTTTTDSEGTKTTESETVKVDGTVEKSTETIKADGSTEKTTETVKADGTTEKSTEEIKPDGSSEKQTEIVSPDSSTKKITEKTKADGSSEKQTEIVSADGSTKKITETTKPNGASEKVTDITKPNGATIHEEVKITAKGKETSQKIETSASGSVKITEQVKQPSGDHSKVVMNKTGKKTVAIKQAVTTAKNGKVSIPKTVNVNGEKLKVTTLKKNFLKGSKTKPKEITINASNITKVAKGAFDYINKKAVIKIVADKKDYKRIQKLIKKSGVGKGVKIKRVK